MLTLKLMSLPEVQHDEPRTDRPPYIFKDNCGATHPRVFETLSQVNASALTGTLDAYGTDSQTESTIDILKSIFGERSRVFFTPTGTFANTLGCSLIQPGEGVWLTPGSHLLTMERGGPKILASPDFIPLPCHQGKLDVDALLRLDPGSDRHIRLVHVTQATEYGTIYTRDELRRIGDFCPEHHLLFGLDGARLPHAAVALGESLKSLTTDVGVDFLTLGVAKLGGMNGNALILTSPELTREKGCFIPDDKRVFELIKLRGGTQSRLWEISAQFSTIFGSDLWHEAAARAIKIASEFKAGLERNGIPTEYPVQTNAVFLRLGEDAQEYLGGLGWRFYQWHEDPCIARFMFAHDTPEGIMRALLDDIIKRHNSLGLNL